MPDRAEMVKIASDAADWAQIPRILMIACGIAESDLDPDARRPISVADDLRYWPDVSFGAWQQTIRWTDEHLKAASKAGADPSKYPGLGTVESIGAAYTDPQYAASVAARNLKGKYVPFEDDGIFKALCRYNWPGGDGEPADDATAANYRRGIAEAERILGVASAPRVTYDPALPGIAQNDDWSCAPTSARWGLRAVGRNPSEQWIESTMLAEGVVSREQGLLDASGAGLASFLNRHYGEFGYQATNDPSVSFDDVAKEAGNYPLLIGGRAWNHWSAVRVLRDGHDVLLLANPANGWGGIEQTMSRQQFASLGPFSMVRLTHPDLMVVPSPPTPPADPRDARIAQLEREKAELVSTLGYLTGDVAKALEAAVATLKRHAP